MIQKGSHHRKCRLPVKPCEGQLVLDLERDAHGRSRRRSQWPLLQWAGDHVCPRPCLKKSPYDRRIETRNRPTKSPALHSAWVDSRSGGEESLHHCPIAAASEQLERASISQACQGSLRQDAPVLHVHV